MRIGRGKIAGLAALILWATVMGLLARWGQDQVLLALVGIGIGASVLVGLLLAKQMVRVRNDQRRANDWELTVTERIDGLAESLQEVQAVQRGAEETATRHDVAQLRKHLAGIAEDHAVKLHEKLAGVVGLAGVVEASKSEVLEALAGDDEASKRQLEALQEVRVDIEWLEQVLQGVSHHLTHGGRAASDGEVGAGSAALGHHVGRRQVQSLQASVEELTALLGAASRTLAASPDVASGTDSSRRLNALTSMFPDPRYLELGLDRGRTFEAVAATSRVGVDPVPRFDTGNLPGGSTVFIGRSDEFFGFADRELEFDVVFVDGLHTFKQTYRDIVHSLRHLRAGGVVLVDDVVPCDEVSAIPDLSRSLAERRARGMRGTPWHGDVFRVVPLLRDAHPRLVFRTIVGSGNEQLVLWNPSIEPVEMVGPDDLAAYGEMEYSDVFVDGVPDYFHPQSEEDVISDVRARREVSDSAV